jgi:hypothetical protein
VGLGRRGRARAELLELVRGELGVARTEIQATLADAAAGIGARVRTDLEQWEQATPALVAALEGVRCDLVARDADLVDALKRVAEAYDLVAERIEADRLERSALVDAVARLAASPSTRGAGSLVPHSGQSVIGGTITPSLSLAPQSPGDNGETPSDMARRAGVGPAQDRPLAGAPRSDGVEVHCRFGGRWVSGFEVYEVVENAGTVRYRLRRRSDDWVLPTLFDEKDVRYCSHDLER